MNRVIGLVSLMALVACGGGGNSPTAAPPVTRPPARVDLVNISPASGSTLQRVPGRPPSPPITMTVRLAPTASAQQVYLLASVRIGDRACEQGVSSTFSLVAGQSVTVTLSTDRHFFGQPSCPIPSLTNLIRISTCHFDGVAMGTCFSPGVGESLNGEFAIQYSYIP